MTLPLVGQRRALKNLILRIFWDGETSASVETPLGDFFGASFGRPVRLVSERLVVEGGAYLCRFEMPFNDGAVVAIENDSDETVRQLFFQIGYYQEPLRKDPAATLHAQFRRQNPTAPEQPFTALQAEGRGWFAGMRVDLQNRQWWLKWPPSDVIVPRGLGLGVLEGWETITIDGDDESRNEGTGGEDYFNGGFYFKGAPFCTPTHGCPLRSFFWGRVSAYRFHVDDPIGFDERIEITLDHGLRNTMAADFTSVCFWYQQEPHAQFPELPSAEERRPTTPCINPIQWLLLMLAAVGAAVICYLLAAG